MDIKDTNPPEGKKFYGSVTVSERGQIVIPAGARRDFNIDTGDKLLVFGDLQQGIGIATLAIIRKNMEGSAEFFRVISSEIEKSDKD
jgi:AbrB family looped-hinge helix DNA binding protein